MPIGRLQGAAQNQAAFFWSLKHVDRAAWRAAPLEGWKDEVRTLWPQMCELGWTGMAIPEAYGGTGNSLTDLAVLCEELGTAPLPGPLFSSAVLCARILLEAGSERMRTAWLPQIAEGSRVKDPAAFAKRVNELLAKQM